MSKAISDKAHFLFWSCSPGGRKLIDLFYELPEQEWIARVERMREEGRISLEVYRFIFEQKD